MRQIDITTWECTACGERVQVPRGSRPLAVLLTLPNRPRERIVTVRDDVVHRCTYGDRSDELTEQIRPERPG